MMCEKQTFVLLLLHNFSDFFWNFFFLFGGLNIDGGNDIMGHGRDTQQESSILKRGY